MVAESRSVNISIRPKNAEQCNVPAVLVADIFQSIQKVLYHIVDYLEGKPARSAGDFSKVTKEVGELVISKICVGSISAGLNLTGPQVALPGMPTFGERAISVGNDIIQTLLSEDISKENIEAKMAELIDEDRTTKILGEMEKIWPDNASKYLIGLGFGTPDLRDLNPNHKPIVTSFLHKPPEIREEVTFGRLTEFRVDQKRKFQVDTPKGIVNCHYNPEIEDYIKDNIGNFIEIHSVVRLDKGVRTLRIDNKKFLETIHALPIYEIKLNDTQISLREPIFLDIVYENESYICTNDELGLFVVDTNLKDVADGINEEMEMLWDIYVKSDVSDLSDDAIKFRTKIISIFSRDDVDDIV